MQEFIPQAIEFAQKHTFLTIAWFAVLFMTLFTFFKSATTEIKNQNVGKIEHHKEKPLIIVDVNGVSSATSAELLTKQGFEKVYVLKDGLAAWAGANLPLVKKHK